MVDYRETGTGPAILFLPGSFATPAAWRAVQGHLPQRYRFVATSLCGYGRTAERRSAGDCGMDHQVAVVEAVARRIAEPVHLVGHSFGATVGLAAALSGRVDILSIATFEANPIHILADNGHDDLVATLRQLRLSLETAWRAGDADAVRQVIDFWGGAGSFAAMPPAVQDYCRQTLPVNLLDWETAFGFTAASRSFAALDMPVLVVRGGRAAPAMVAITDGLAACLHDARMAVVDGANHFLISTHAKACAERLEAFITEIA